MVSIAIILQIWKLLANKQLVFTCVSAAALNSSTCEVIIPITHCWKNHQEIFCFFLIRQDENNSKVNSLQKIIPIVTNSLN